MRDESILIDVKLVEVVRHVISCHVNQCSGKLHFAEQLCVKKKAKRWYNNVCIELILHIMSQRS